MLTILVVLATTVVPIFCTFYQAIPVGPAGGQSLQNATEILGIGYAFVVENDDQAAFFVSGDTIVEMQRIQYIGPNYTIHSQFHYSSGGSYNLT